ncbi:MAG: DUF222 domain-containing protein [Nocardioidaceae bacterium]
MEPSVQLVLDRLDEVFDAVAVLPVDDRVRVLDVVVGRVQSRQADAVGVLAGSSVLAASGCRTVGSWARLQLRRGTSGFRLVRRAAVLPDLPEVAAAFAAGAITDEHVDTLVRATRLCGLETVQTHQTTLVTLAKAASANEVQQAVEVLADLVRPDRDADLVAALGGRRVTIAGLGDLVHVDALVEPALGEALKTAVEAGAAHPPGVAADGRTLAQRRADAFGEIVLAGIATGLFGTDRDTDRTDASDRDIDRTDDTGSGGTDTTGGTGRGRPPTGGRGSGRGSGRLRPQVAVTVTLETLAGLPGAPKALLEHFGVVPTPTLRRLVCDGDLARVVLHTASGLPLNVGRSSRLAVKRQRRALAVVFRCCVFPGCTVPFRFCEIHHRDWWCRGGDTDLALLLPYCWTHHHFLHEDGFTVTHHPDGRLVHHRPDGAAIPDPDHHLKTAVDQLTLDLRTTPPASKNQRPPPAA